MNANTKVKITPGLTAQRLHREQLSIYQYVTPKAATVNGAESKICTNIKLPLSSETNTVVYFFLQTAG